MEANDPINDVVNAVDVSYLLEESRRPGGFSATCAPLGESEIEFFVEIHHQLNEVERIGQRMKIPGMTCSRRSQPRSFAKDFHDFIFNGGHKCVIVKDNPVLART